MGSHLCDRFIKEGMHVIGMDNLITGDLKNIQHLFKLKNFEFYHCDVSKFIHVPGKLDYILHFASPASPIDYLKIPIQTLKVSSLGTHNCLGLALSKKARILVASTSEVYGDPLALRFDRVGDGAVFGDHQIHDADGFGQIDLLRARIAALCDAGIDDAQGRCRCRENV